MNITWRGRNKVADILVGPSAEDINRNLDTLFQDMAANLLAMQAYKVDLANDVDVQTFLALTRLSGIDPTNTTQFLRRDGTWQVGPVGATGPPGATGATGAAGATGATGATGPSGTAPILVTTNQAVTTNTGVVIPESLEIQAGIIWEIEGGARVEITGPAHPE